MLQMNATEVVVVRTPLYTKAAFDLAKLKPVSV